MPPLQGTENPIEGPGDYTTTKNIHSDSYAAISPSKFDLNERAVLITGASKGLGVAIALAYAQAGASYIALGARGDLTSVKSQVERAAEEGGRPPPKILGLQLDVTNPQSVDAAVKDIWQHFGRLDVVINNAGIFGERKPLGDSDVDTWWSVLETNLKGPYLIARATLPYLIQTNNGLKTLITVASVGALLVGPGLSAYQGSKLAVLRMTEFVAADYKDQGVTAISVHPGNMPTDMTSGTIEAIPWAKAVFVDTVQLAAHSIVYLSAMRLEWLSGRYVNCTWDLPELVERKDDILKGDKLKMKLDVP